MQFDMIGLLFFLWFIYRGLQKSQQSKRAHEQRQQERQEQRTTVQRTQPVKQAPRRAMPEPKAAEEGAPTSPFPPWFPFPIEIIEEVSEKKKPRVKPVVEPALVKAKAREVAPPRPIVEPIMATAISQGEEQWKSGELGLSLDKKSVVNGIIWAEVLGAPRSKRSNHRF